MTGWLRPVWTIPGIARPAMRGSHRCEGVTRTPRLHRKTEDSTGAAPGLHRGCAGTGNSSAAAAPHRGRGWQSPFPWASSEGETQNIKIK